ncbi:MAG: hypothetical protein Q9216_002589 [Gyalolechia sp. 2 TL-2023]
MDVHRCRFVPYPPSAINALAFSHSSLTSLTKEPSTLRLAIGRANGDIEVWNPLKGAWHQETTFRGGKDRSIEGLVWTHDPEDEDKNGYRLPGKLRLFSIGYSSSVTEWDLGSGRPLRHASGNYGELWCMAAQPRVHSADKVNTETVNGVGLGAMRHQSLAVGCADGSIVLLSTADGDLQFQKTLSRPPKKKARVLSIAWQSRNIVIAGHADSMIRVFDVRNGQQIRAMSLGAGPQGGPKEILVWSVKAAADGTVISGDSTGTVSFWDARNYSRLQRITSHKADILDIAVSGDGETVFSGSMDRRTTLYRRTAGSKLGEKRRWAEIAHQRFHSHDVKSMAVFETKKMSTLASGGLDTLPIIVPVREFGREHHRTLSNLPLQPPVRSAPKKRLLLSWWDREVGIWRISRSWDAQDASGMIEGLPQPPAKKLVAKILLQGEESITGADILEDASLLVVSTLSEIKMFRLRESGLVDSAIRLRKIDLPSELFSKGARSIQFSPDGKWLLFITSMNKVQLVRIVRSEDRKELPRISPQPITLRRLPRKARVGKHLHGSLGAYDRSICRVAFSADSRILVVGDLSGYIDAFVLEGFEDLTQDPPITNPEEDISSSSSSSSSSDESDPEAYPTLVYGQHWRRSPTAHLIPKLPSAPLIISFRPVIPSPALPTALTNGTTAHLHPTRHNPHPHSRDLPKGEDRLFILTAGHQLYEFDVLAGKISDWSRRNPTSTLPMEFRNIKDRAMGCVWDVAASGPKTGENGDARQRIWLYGSSWLWMFDLGRDFPKTEEEDKVNDKDEGEERDGMNITKSAKRKRKRRGGQGLTLTHDDGDQGGGDRKRSKKQRDTGAGSRIPAHEIQTGIGRSIRKTVGPEGRDPQLIDLDHGVGESDNERDSEGFEYYDDDEEDSSALMRLRRSGHDDDDDDDDKETGEPGEEEEEEGGGKPKSLPYWGTYKYRPILGIVPVGDCGGHEKAGVEVALVERPVFDLDLPGRYLGDQEWSERKDVGDLGG